MQISGKKEIGSVEFIALVAFIMLLTALAIDIMLPAFDDLREYFGLGSESTATAQIVTFFFLGQVGQLVFGPLADRYGRIRIMRIGFALYIGGCLAAAFSPSLEFIFLARFVVGLGAAALSVSATTSVRDRFAGDKMARTMSFILTIFLCVPIFAPILGALILSISSWQVVFLTPPVIAIFVFFWSFRLPESLPPEKRLKLNLPTVLGSAREVLGNPTFVRYAAITTILFSALSSFVGSSERIVSEIYGRPDLFIWVFSGMGVVLAFSTFLNAQLVGRFGAQRTGRSMIVVYLVAAVLLLVLSLASQGSPALLLFFVFIALLQGLNVAIEPNNGALAMESLGSTAGMAAAIYGTSFFVIGSLIGSMIDRMLVDSVMPLVVAYVIAGTLSALLAFAGRSTARQ